MHVSIVGSGRLGRSLAALLPDSIDVAYANGGITADSAHPIPGYEAIGSREVTIDGREPHELLVELRRKQ